MGLEHWKSNSNFRRENPDWNVYRAIQRLLDQVSGYMVARSLDFEEGRADPAEDRRCATTADRNTLWRTPGT